MRDRKDFEISFNWMAKNSQNQQLILEVLLDIRDLLKTNNKTELGKFLKKLLMKIKFYKEKL